MGLFNGLNFGEIAKQSARGFSQKSFGNLDRIRQRNFQNSGGRGFRPLNLRPPGLSDGARANLAGLRSTSSGIVNALSAGGDNLLLASTRRAIAQGQSLSSEQSRFSQTGNLTDNLQSQNIDVDNGNIVDEEA